MSQWLNKKSFILAILAMVSFWGCGESKLPPFEYFPDMADSLAVESQEEYYFNPNRSGGMLPPEGTVARDFYPYPYDSAFVPEELTNEDRGLKNPFKMTAPNVKRGEERFQIYCYPCHGVRGEGNGPVIGPEPKFLMAPPTLLSEKVKGWSDGQIYHLITKGRGLMASHAHQVDPDDRWKIVMYIRRLQAVGGK